jgi:triosephosphate isomerase
MVGRGVFWPASRFIGTSCKMNHTRAETHRYLARLESQLTPYPESLLVFILPPFTSLSVAEELLGDGPILYGAQDVHEDDAGAHTGDVSAPMLAELGCSLVEVGHSERRRDHGETDEGIAGKIRAVWRHAMVPLLCIGESRDEYERGGAVRALIGQLRGALGDATPAELGRLVLAYEPRWAIGSGATAAPVDHVATMIEGIRGWLAPRTESPAAVPVLYGGSSDAANARTLLAAPGVDGLFVGRAALDPDVFAQIVRIGRESIGDVDDQMALPT